MNIIGTPEKDAIIGQITTDKAPLAVGPYSQGTSTGDFVFTARKIPMGPESGKIKRQSRSRPNRH